MKEPIFSSEEAFALKVRKDSPFKDPVEEPKHSALADAVERYLEAKDAYKAQMESLMQEEGLEPSDHAKHAIYHARDMNESETALRQALAAVKEGK